MIRKRNIAFLCTLLLGIFLFASASSASTLQKPPNNLGLVGYWPMNEGTSTQAGDFSGRGNTGTLTNMANPATATSGWGNGKLGGGLNFDAVDDFINAGSGSSLADFSALTTSVWIKPRSLGEGNFGRIVEKGASGVNGWSIYFDSSGGITFDVEFPSYLEVITSANSVNLNAWQHVVVVWDGSGTAANVKIYVNGTEKSHATNVNGSGTRASDASVGMTIGNRSNTTRTFDGTIDDVRIYNRALSVAEITNLYQSGSAKLNTSQNNKVTNGLVGLWSFDGADMSGTTAYNRGTASGANGTLTGGTTRTIGKIGQGMSFDGVDDYVDVPYTNLDFERTDPFSFSVWAKWEDVVPAGGGQALLGRFTGGTTGTSFIQCKNAQANICYVNSVALALYGTVGALTVSTAAGSFLPNTWTHIVVTYDGSSSPGGIKIYKNGVSMPLTTQWSTLGGTIKTGTNWRIGDDYTNDWMKGNMDDVRIYNRALTQAEVTQLYLLGK